MKRNLCWLTLCLFSFSYAGCGEKPPNTTCEEEPTGVDCPANCIDLPTFFVECQDCTAHPESPFCSCGVLDPEPCCLTPEDLSCGLVNNFPNHGGAGDEGIPCDTTHGDFCGPDATPDGFDGNCNGVADEGCGCSAANADVLSCYTGPAGTRNVGTCADGVALCDNLTREGEETWGNCSNQVLPLGGDDCGGINTPPSDTNCNGVAGDGCPSLFASCPAEVFSAPLQTKTLTAVAVTSGALISTQWIISQRPVGSTSGPSPANALATEVLLDVAGDFTLTFTAIDDLNQSASCSTIIHAIPTENLRLELSWNNAADLDLHLLHPTATRWEDPVLDCNAFNCAAGLSWPGVGTGDDPRAALSDTDGFGPENINIDFPEVNTGNAYRVGVYAFTDNGVGPSDVTMRIFCGGILKAQLTHNDLIGSAQGAIPNELWKVVDTAFNSATTCAVTPIDQIVPMDHLVGVPR